MRQDSNQNTNITQKQTASYVCEGCGALNSVYNHECEYCGRPNTHEHEPKQQYPLSKKNLLIIAPELTNGRVCDIYIDDGLAFTFRNSQEPKYLWLHDGAHEIKAVIRLAEKSRKIIEAVTVISFEKNDSCSIQLNYSLMSGRFSFDAKKVYSFQIAEENDFQVSESVKSTENAQKRQQSGGGCLATLLIFGGLAIALYSILSMMK
jgi:hypothetical protein